MLASRADLIKEEEEEEDLIAAGRPTGDSATRPPLSKKKVRFDFAAVARPTAVVNGSGDRLSDMCDQNRVASPST